MILWILFVFIYLQLGVAALAFFSKRITGSYETWVRANIFLLTIIFASTAFFGWIISLPKVQSLSIAIFSLAFEKRPFFQFVFQLFLPLAAGTLATLIIRGIFSTFREIKALVQLKRESFRIKTMLKTEIYINDEITSPFAFRFFHLRYVFLPEYLLENRKDFRNCLSHELQHHRSHDTIHSYVTTLTRILTPMNPWAKSFLNTFRQTQELAVDAKVTERKNADDYCRTLLNVSVKKSRSNFSLPLTMSTQSFQEMKRRIMMIKDDKKRKPSSKIQNAIVFATLLSTLLGSMHLLAKTHLSATRLKELILNTSTNSKIPVDLNDTVVRQMDFYLNSKAGRRFVSDSLAKLGSYEKLFAQKMEEYGAPKELVAVAMMESGFVNHPQKEKGMKAAGIWQFIPQTARDFGLKVRPHIENGDERQDVDKSTDAAIRLLKSLYLQFGDWRLAILAYNAGAQKIRKGIEKTQSRDPWILIENRFGGDKDYLAKVIAGIVILSNSSMIQGSV